MLGAEAGSRALSLHPAPRPPSPTPAQLTSPPHPHPLSGISPPAQGITRTLVACSCPLCYSWAPVNPHLNLSSVLLTTLLIKESKNLPWELFTKPHNYKHIQLTSNSTLHQKSHRIFNTVAKNVSSHCIFYLWSDSLQSSSSHWPHIAKISICVIPSSITWDWIVSLSFLRVSCTLIFSSSNKFFNCS